MDALVRQCLAHGPLDGVNPTAIEGLSVYRRETPAASMSAVYERSIILVVQGRKRAWVGEDAFVYDPDNYLVTSVPMPVSSELLVASVQRPFLSLVIHFEFETLRELMTRMEPAPVPAVEPPQRGLVASPVTAEIRDIAGRLLGLLDQPRDIPVLAPLYLRELLYRALEGPRGGFLRAVAMGHGHQQAIADVLGTIHGDCTQTFVVSDLAASAGMSESVFYEAFKSVTASSPMPYIKRLRLQEAHRQLSLGLSNVSGAAYGVGYNSLSQFTREFTRVFGANPSAVLSR